MNFLLHLRDTNPIGDTILGIEYFIVKYVKTYKPKVIYSNSDSFCKLFNKYISYTKLDTVAKRQPIHNPEYDLTFTFSWKDDYNTDPSYDININLLSLYSDFENLDSVLISQEKNFKVDDYILLQPFSANAVNLNFNDWLSLYYFIQKHTKYKPIFVAHDKARIKAITNCYPDVNVLEVTDELTLNAYKIITPNTGYYHDVVLTWKLNGRTDFKSIITFNRCIERAIFVRHLPTYYFTGDVLITSPKLLDWIKEKLLN